MHKSLSNFKQGDIVKINCFKCGLHFKNRLSDLGLYEGAEIEIIKNDMTGPIIVRILNSKMALGRGEASKIYAQKI